jgi:hypothetical protein
MHSFLVLNESEGHGDEIPVATFLFFFVFFYFGRQRFAGVALDYSGASSGRAGIFSAVFPIHPCLSCTV